MHFIVVLTILCLWRITDCATMAEAVASIAILEKETVDRVPIDSESWKCLYENISVDHGALIPHPLKLIIREGQTGVYEVTSPEDTPQMVLVYRQYCESDRHPVSTTVIDFWFLRHLAQTGLVPQVYTMSAPLGADKLLNGGDPSDRAQLHEIRGKINWTVCRHGIPEVRYILMEKVNAVSLYDLVSRDGRLVKQPLTRAIRYTIHMLEFIERIHAQNVTHGDAQFGNFMVNPDTGEVVKMIDFERAAMFNEREISTLPRQCRYRRDSDSFVFGIWISPWEARMCAKSFRDDIYRIFITMAVMMFGEEYLRYQNILLEGATPAYTSEHTQVDPEIVLEVFCKHWRMHRNAGEIFEIHTAKFQTVLANAGISKLGKFFKTELHVRELVPAPVVDVITDRFAVIQLYIISIGITERPDYGFLKSFLQNVSDIIDTQLGD
jgi:serine/threonine protein kinase